MRTPAFTTASADVSDSADSGFTEPLSLYMSGSKMAKAASSPELRATLMTAMEERLARIDAEDAG